MNEPPPPPELLAEVMSALQLGLAVFDHDHRLAYASPDLWRSLDVDPALIPAGAQLSDIIRLFAYRGLYGPGDPEAQAAEALRIDRSRPSCRLTRTVAGRSLELHSVPLPGGGFASCWTDVTRPAQLAAEATARSHLVEGVLARLGTGLALFGPNRELLLHNAAYEALGGLPSGILRLGMTHTDVLRAKEARGEFANIDGPGFIASQLRLDRSAAHRFQRERPGGAVIRASSRPLPDGSYLLEVDDITALKRAEDEACRRAALLDGVLAALPLGVCVYGSDQRASLVNAAYGRIMGDATVQVGDRREDVVDRRLAIGEYSAEEAAALHRSGLDGGLSRPRHYRRIRPNGTALDIRTAPLPDGGHASVVADITELLRAEEEARRRSAIQQVMLDNTRHGICLFDAESRVVAANALAARMIGLEPEDLAPGRTLAELRRLQLERGEFGTGKKAEREAEERAARAWTLPDRYVRVRGNGMVLEVATDATPDGGFVRTYTDVTEDRRIRAELEGARIAAEEGSQAKSRFLATMSHELRTPLNAVIGFSEALLMPGGRLDAALVTEYARAINEAGRHLLSLIDDILDVARNQTIGLDTTEAEVDLLALLEGAVRVMRAGAAIGGVALTAGLPPDLPHCRADERRLRQILLNLLSNAVKFTPAGGSVALSVEQDAGGITIRVADTGIGMRSEDIPRAFEPFTQLDASLARRFPGSGLGLHLSRGLAEAMGGSLTLTSEPGRGTVALLCLPADRLLPATTAVAATP